MRLVNVHREPLVRPADPADFDAVLGVFDACWQMSYRGVLPDAVIATMTAPVAAAMWQRVFASAAPGELLVAEALPGGQLSPGRPGPEGGVDDRGGVVGVARWAVTAPGVGWLHSLYVDPRCQGTGIGGALLAAVEQRLAAAGVTTAHLWAFAANASGRRFYAERGWALDGEERVEDAFGEPEVRFTKLLGDAP